MRLLAFFLLVTYNMPSYYYISVTCQCNILRCRTATYWTAIFGQVAQGIHLPKSQDYLFDIIKYLLNSSEPDMEKISNFNIGLDVRSCPILNSRLKYFAISSKYHIIFCHIMFAQFPSTEKLTNMCLGNFLCLGIKMYRV